MYIVGKIFELEESDQNGLKDFKQIWFSNQYCLSLMLDGIFKGLLHSFSKPILEDFNFDM